MSLPGAPTDAAQSPARGEWRLQGPLDLRKTLIGGHGPLDRPCSLHGAHAGAGSWRAAHFDSGPATVHVRVQGTQLIAHAWGSGAAQALDGVPAWVGLADSWPCQPPGPAWNGRLRELWRQHPGLRLGAGRRLSEVLVPIVLAQRVTHEEAVRGYILLTRRCGEPAPGPKAGLWLPPSPRAVLATPLHALRADGIEKARARTLREIASAALAIDRLDPAAPRDAFDKLRSIHGIGPWTAAIGVARSFGWADAVPLNDYDMPNAIGWNLAGERQASDERMLELLEPFRGMRWRVIALIAAAGAFPPRRAPRYRNPDFAGRERPPRS